MLSFPSIHSQTSLLRDVRAALTDWWSIVNAEVAGLGARVPSPSRVAPQSSSSDPLPKALDALVSAPRSPVASSNVAVSGERSSVQASVFPASMRADNSSNWSAVPLHSASSRPPRHDQSQPLLSGSAGGGGGLPDDFIFHETGSSVPGRGGAAGSSVVSVPPEDEELLDTGHESYDGGSFEPDLDEGAPDVLEPDGAPTLQPKVVHLTGPAPPPGLGEADLSLTARINAHLLAAAAASHDVSGPGGLQALRGGSVSAYAARRRADDEAWDGAASDGSNDDCQ